MSLCGQVCLVTGASRGIGKGIATELAIAGATVFCTGRTLHNDPTIPGSLDETEKEINALASKTGGKCIAVQCDHSSDEQVEALFKRIQSKHNRLDIVVNNAYGAVNAVMESAGTKFYQRPLSDWDASHRVGLRSHYVCSVLAARFWDKTQTKGLIVNVSSAGGLMYLFQVAYGAGKAALDRMSSDTAIELTRQGTTVISLWPGPVRTELIGQAIDKDDASTKMRATFSHAESPRFSGRCVVNFALDKRRFSKTGKVMCSAELGEQYGFSDVDGTRPLSMFSLSALAHQAKMPRLAWCLPRRLKVPKFALTCVFKHQFGV